jgi:hypothetical protein
MSASSILLDERMQSQQTSSQCSLAGICVYVTSKTKSKSQGKVTRFRGLLETKGGKYLHEFKPSVVTHVLHDESIKGEKVVREIQDIRRLSAEVSILSMKWLAACEQENCRAPEGKFLLGREFGLQR